MYTKTEALRRLRELMRQWRAADGNVKKTWRVEVGHRTYPMTVTDPDHDELYHEHDDLADYDTLVAAAATDDVRAHGAVVHLYVTEPGEWGELYDVQVGWMGTPDEEPRMLLRKGW